MQLPRFSFRRDQPVRRLSAAECDLLEYAPPLVLARREYRFMFRSWRPTTTYLVVRHPDRILMTCTKEQLEARGISITSATTQQRRRPT